MKRRRSNALVALSSAAVMTVYAAGFMRTRAAAERLEHSSRARPPVIPAPAPLSAAPMVKATAPPPSVAPVAKPPKKLAPKPLKVAKPEIAAPEKQPVAAVVVTPEVPPPPAAPPEPVAVLPPPPLLSPSAEVLLGGTELHDGTFLGWGTSRHGDIQASVTLLSGRITAVSIAQCRTRYSCDVIAHLPAKVLKDQTPEKINNVSGATQSVDAFYYAVVDAMNKAKAK